MLYALRYITDTGITDIWCFYPTSHVDNYSLNYYLDSNRDSSISIKVYQDIVNKFSIRIYYINR